MAIVNFTNTVPLPLSDPQYDTLVKTVLANYPRACIVMIDKIQIPEVNIAYEQKRGEDPESEELSLWHGTREAFVEGICKNGFLPNHGRTMAYGDGIYFAKEFKYSWSYCPPEGELSYIFLCKVQPGKTYSSGGHRGPPPEGYDSCSNGSTIYAISQATRMKPDYLIRFHKQSEMSAVPKSLPLAYEEEDQAAIERKVAKMMKQMKVNVRRNLH